MMRMLSVDRYSRVAMALHWLIALALAFQIALGWRLEDIARGPAQFSAFQLHKSIGITILLLTVARISVRLLKPPPAHLPDAGPAVALSKLVHALLYIFMIGAPLTGWALVSTAKVQLPTVIFGVLPWPHLPLGQGWRDPADAAHGALAWLGATLIVLHVAGALRHQFFRGDDILRRMLPVNGGGAALVAAILAVVGLSFASAWQVDFGGAPARAIDPPKTIAAPKEAPAAPPAARDELEEAVAESPAEPVSTWRVNRGGRLGFTASWNGNAIDGQFREWDADIRFSPDDLAGSSIVVTIDIASADSGDSQRDEMLRGADWFDASQYARATWRSTVITHLGGDRYRARGTLTLRGRTRPVPLDFSLTINGDAAKASGAATLDRNAFEVGSGEGSADIAPQVEVRFSLTARRSS